MEHESALCADAQVARATSSRARAVHALTRSIRIRVIWLVITCLVPAGLAGMLLLHHSYETKRQAIEQHLVSFVRALSLNLDQELAGIQATIRTLALSPHLTSGDLAAFHAQAREVLRDYDDADIILSDANSQQVVNSFRPFGDRLPRRGVPEIVRQVFETRQPLITPMFSGAVTGRHLISIDVPVIRNDQVIYDLAMTIPARRLGAVLTHQNLPPEWLGLIIDNTGIIAVRTRNPEVFVGRPASRLNQRMSQVTSGILVIDAFEGELTTMAFSRSEVSGWSVVVGIPTAMLTAETRWSLLMSGAVALLLLGAGIALAIPLSHGIARSTLLLSAHHHAQMLAHDRERRRAEEARFQAQHDGLTGLANRGLFNERLEQAIATARGSRHRVGVLFIDLDNFKTVNDSQGHDMGDRLLKLVADRLLAITRSSDTVARLGGDEFAVVTALEVTGTDLSGMCHRILQDLRQGFAAEFPDLTIGASIGIAVCPDDGEDVASLLRSADIAMYQAKTAGKGSFRFFSPDHAREGVAHATAPAADCNG
ncbi:GGDEF domain-containing protein [Rhodovastum atsumiense]|uniref:GGDEF domain-containing protein n=1 Tax=Rhodovastum atsumiense TaxID=504468 RepID=A0A5M6INP7_9PROT|nr:sensor domain-containing diguanylate cyclase [Rhodovastum atsumiense]KAA5609529.1 GGDEF domain-containing protein [Rhodovastum atsumiense]CAH2604942.1 GGDEF domain-containing protein [Rhodovastum atsumiense]